ncbi:hypothetical protein E4U13_004710 [Claviceps humidiphila]|uniref:Uncharacterized protein n=1 Tax=Claviceps humidiphila TaxID=1294629 RepID=A0A9P7TT59_9HYPO|nr:hypothetical protein E4U13_004710 [Claviceps humidiphila]
MATGTRASARGSEAPDPPANVGQQVPPATTTTDDEMAALQRELAMAEMREKISQSEARRRAFDQENVPGTGAPNAPSIDAADTTG